MDKAFEMDHKQHIEEIKKLAYERLAKLNQEWLMITPENFESKRAYLHKERGELIELIHNMEEAEMTLADG